MVILIGRIRSGASARRLLRIFDLTKHTRQQFWSEARRRAHERDSLTGSFVLHWLLAAFLGLFLFSTVLAAASNLFGSFSFSLVVAGMVVLAYLPLTKWVFDRREFPGMRRAMAGLLYERGYRFCRTCLYDLRQLPGEVEECPECGTFISRRISADFDDVPILEHRQNPMSRIHEVVRGGRVPARAVESALLKGRERYAATRKHIWRGVNVCTITALLLVIPFGAAIDYLLPDMSKWALVLFMLLPAAIVITASAWITMRLHDNEIRAARQVLRRGGYEVCIRCGKYLACLADEVTECPSCHAQRNPLPRSRA